MTAPRVTIYTLSACGPCLRARRLLRRRGIAFDEIRGDDDPAFDRLLLERTGGLTVPQIVIDDVPIGGADSLERLDRLGVLPELLGEDRFPLARIVRRLSLRGIVEMYLSGGSSGPWRYRVELVDALGHVVERHGAASAEEAGLLAASLRRRAPAKLRATTTNGHRPGG
ncbi:MAG: glutaredoxin domain-containing protein [Thermoleophilaceae bacterium]